MAMCTTIVETQRDDDAEDGEGWLDLSDQHQMQNRQFTAYHSSDDYGWPLTANDQKLIAVAQFCTIAQENLNSANAGMEDKEDNDIEKGAKRSMSSKDLSLLTATASKAYNLPFLTDNGANYLHPCAITAFAALNFTNTSYVSTTMVNIPPPKKPTTDPSKRISTATKRTSTAPSRPATTDSIHGPTDPPSRASNTAQTRPVTGNVTAGLTRATARTTAETGPKNATALRPTTTGASRTTSLAQPKTATTTQAKNTTTTALPKPATARAAPSKPATIKATPLKPATTSGSTVKPSPEKRGGPLKTETTVKKDIPEQKEAIEQEDAAEKEDGTEKKDDTEKKDATEKKDTPEKKDIPKKKETPSEFVEPVMTPYTAGKETPAQTRYRENLEAKIAQLKILAAVPRLKFYLVLDILHHQNPPQPYTLIDQFKRHMNIDGLNWEPVFVPADRTKEEILVGVKEEKAPKRPDPVGLDLSWRGRYRKFSSERSKEYGGGENWVPIDENRESFYASFLRLRKQKSESGEERVLREEIEELERMEEMEVYARGREERTRKLKEAGETGVRADLGSGKVDYPDGDQNELPDLPIRKIHLEIYLETAKKDQIIADLPNAIKMVEQKMDKRIPTVYLYTTIGRGIDPDKLIFKSERPIEGLDRPDLEQVIETEERKRPWCAEHAPGTGCLNQTRPSDKTWNNFTDVAGFKREEMEKGWKGNPYYGPDYSKPIERHPRGLGNVILGMEKDKSISPQTCESHVNFGNVSKVFTPREGWDTLLEAGKGRLLPFFKGDAGDTRMGTVKGELVVRSLVAMRKEERDEKDKKEEGQRGMRWDTTEEKYHWTSFLESREKQEEERKVKEMQEAMRLKALLGAVREKMDAEHAAQENNNGAEDVTEGNDGVKEVAEEHMSNEKAEEDIAEEAEKAEFLRLKEATENLGLSDKSD
ncbi:hypothetical protein EG328_004657 [Venturia inaequalis]|uniref:Uncharacterized protein n=1 Tax=Venturia inaequalis TaxID=5025 RepID=A0A8H3YTK9_VENIN|nr:hypothetical protein EG328_004657 [Venturia inaequalis]